MTHTSRPRSMRDLEDTLHRIDGRGYPAYKDLKGSWALRERDDGTARLTLHVDRVQADPYAPPSQMRVSLDTNTANLPGDLIDDLPGRVATADFMLRAIHSDLQAAPGGVSAGTPTQEIIERSGVAVTDDGVEARLSVPLPADRRRVLGRRTDELLLDILPNAVGYRLRADGLDLTALRDHVTLYRDQLAAQTMLAERHLVGFVADGAILPRASGDSDLPLASAVPFASPSSLSTTLRLPSGRTVTGMGIPAGITVIIGGGFHGKSTLLRALVRGIHPHLAGDGREFVLAEPSSVPVRAEDGRAVTGVDISPFINNLPSGATTTDFTTPNASGSTSQAAAVVEALEMGARTLFLDEDSCATNFMMRDRLMRSLVTHEPITPFVERIQGLARSGVSTVLVAGGSSSFLPHADLVLSMDAYRVTDVTRQAHSVTGRAEREADARAWCPTTDGLLPSSGTVQRVLASGALTPPGSHGKRPRPPAARGRGAIRMGEDTIDASTTTLVDWEQTEGVARALAWIAEHGREDEPFSSALSRLGERLAAHGLAVLTEDRAHPEHVALPRIAEVAAAINRYRGLRLEAQRPAAPIE